MTDHASQRYRATKRQEPISFRRVRLLAAMLSVLMSVSISAIAEDGISASPPGKCDIGPLNKTFGMTQWLVYSCTTDRNVVIVSAPGNPAFPFVFAFFVRDEKYELHGEGTGDRKASDAAFNELKSLSERDIAALIEETKSLGGKTFSHD